MLSLSASNSSPRMDGRFRWPTVAQQPLTDTEDELFASTPVLIPIGSGCASAVASANPSVAPSATPSPNGSGEILLRCRDAINRLHGDVEEERYQRKQLAARTHRLEEQLQFARAEAEREKAARIDAEARAARMESRFVDADARSASAHRVPGDASLLELPGPSSLELDEGLDATECAALQGETWALTVDNDSLREQLRHAHTEIGDLKSHLTMLKEQAAELGILKDNLGHREKALHDAHLMERKAAAVEARLIADARLAEAKRSADVELGQLQRKLATSEAAQKCFERREDELKQHVEVAEHRCKLLQTTESEVKDKQDQWQHRMIESERRASEAEHALTTWIAVVTEDRDQLGADLTRVQKQLEAVAAGENDVLNQLQSEMHAANSERQQALEQLHAKTETETQLRNGLAEMERSQVQSQDRCAELETQLQAMHTRAVNTNPVAFDASGPVLEATSQSTVEEALRLAAENGSLREQLRQAQVDTVEARSRLAIVQDQIMELDASRRSFEQQEKALEDARAQAMERMEATEEVQRCAMLQTAEVQMSAKRDLSALRQQLETANEVLSEYKTRTEAAEFQCQQASRDAAMALKQCQDDWSQRVAHLTGTTRSTERECESRLGLACRERDRLAEEVESMQRQLIDQQGQASTTQHMLEDRLASAVAHNDALAVDVAKMQTRLLDAEQQAAEAAIALRQQVEAVTEDRDRLTASLCEAEMVHLEAKKHAEEDRQTLVSQVALVTEDRNTLAMDSATIQKQLTALATDEREAIHELQSRLEAASDEKQQLLERHRTHCEVEVQLRRGLAVMERCRAQALDKCAELEAELSAMIDRAEHIETVALAESEAQEMSEELLQRKLVESRSHCMELARQAEEVAWLRDHSAEQVMRARVSGLSSQLSGSASRNIRSAPTSHECTEELSADHATDKTAWKFTMEESLCLAADNGSLREQLCAAKLEAAEQLSCLRILENNLAELDAARIHSEQRERGLQELSAQLIALMAAHQSPSTSTLPQRSMEHAEDIDRVALQAAQTALKHCTTELRLDAEMFKRAARSEFAAVKESMEVEFCAKKHMLDVTETYGNRVCRLARECRESAEASERRSREDAEDAKKALGRSQECWTERIVNVEKRMAEAEAMLTSEAKLMTEQKDRFEMTLAQVQQASAEAEAHAAAQLSTFEISQDKMVADLGRLQSQLDAQACSVAAGHHLKSRLEDAISTRDKLHERHCTQTEVETQLRQALAVMQSSCTHYEKKCEELDAEWRAANEPALSIVCAQVAPRDEAAEALQEALFQSQVQCAEFEQRFMDLEEKEVRLKMMQELDTSRKQEHAASVPHKSPAHTSFSPPQGRDLHLANFYELKIAKLKRKLVELGAKE